MGVKKVRIGTFNLNNLALPNVEYYPNECYSEETYQKKCMWTARQLDLMKADLVVFQEVFHEEALAHALSFCTPMSENLKMRIFVPQEQSLTPKVCMATRYDVNGCEWITDIPKEVNTCFNAGCMPVSLDGKPIDRFSRPVLRARVVLPDLGEGLEGIIYGTHLKSKSPDALPEGTGGDLNNPIGQARSLIRRCVEAVGLRCLVLRDLTPPMGVTSWQQSPVILCGDCNDDTIAVTTQILCGVQSNNFAKRLRSALELHSSRSLYSAYYTYIHDGHYESLDHIFLSDHFSPGNDRRLGDVEYVRFLTDHLVDRQLYRDSIPEYQSDHGQVVVTIKPKRKEAVD